MPGQYLIRGAVRPRLCSGAEETDASARLYLCARCRAQVLICSCCDRGNIYCERGCAAESRRTRQRASGQRYQRSLGGRRNHAARAKRYRARQNKVTHQGSPRPPPDDVMRASAASARNPQTPRAVPVGWVPALLDWEEQERARRSLERRLAEAHIGRFKPLSAFDYPVTAIDPKVLRSSRRWHTPPTAAPARGWPIGVRCASQRPKALSLRALKSSP